MSERLRFVVEAEAERVPFTELCAAFGIKPKTGYKWWGRYRSDGVDGLRDQSRAPKSHPQAMPEYVAERLVELRRRHRWGPRKLLDRLAELEPSWSLPAASTVGDLLKRRGLVEPRAPQRRIRSPHTQPLAHADRPNAVWTVDFKGDFRTGDGKRCYPLTIADAYSRYLARCVGLPRPDFDGTREVFVDAFRELGLPSVIRCDNGSPFASHGAGGLTRLSAWWVRLGIHFERIAPGRPDQNGRHERMHRTLKQDAICPPDANLRRQQRRFDEFRRVYNEERPHEALGGKTPSKRYLPSLRPYPERLPEFEYSAHVELRSVRAKGSVPWRGKDLFLTQALAGQSVGFEPIDLGLWRVVYGPVVLAYWSEPLAHLGFVRPDKWRGPK